VNGVHALPDGGYEVRLEPEERDLLRALAAELEELVAAEDPVTRRLFPPAYKDSPDDEAEYYRLVHSTLASGRVEALRRLRATAHAVHLTQDDADVWCGTLNDLRLVLGDQLDVTEELDERGFDPSHPDAAELSLYGWLTWLQGSVIDALASRLPPPSSA
jgi:hypothetical protein